MELKESSSSSSSLHQYADLADFLSKHYATESEKSTHTRIKKKELNISGGSYTISKEELPVFYHLYYDYVFVKNRKEYLTEKQLLQKGPLLVDFDFRHSLEVKERQFTSSHIQDILQLYLETLKEFFVFEEDMSFPIFVMEKPSINRLEDKQYVKDGIHMIFGIQMDNVLQSMLRERILEQIGDVCDLDIINTWEEVLDNGITEGGTNWQMYGSQKPGHEAYKVAYALTAEKKEGGNIRVKSMMSEFVLSEATLPLLSAQYDGHVSFALNPDIQDAYNKRLSETTKKSGGGGGGKRRKPSKRRYVFIDEDEDDEGVIQLSDITNHEILQKAVDNIMRSLSTSDLYLRDIHAYTQILPEKYYEPGSHLLNRKVAFALKHTDNRLFLSWVMLRAKASDFDFDTIPSLYESWRKHFNQRPDGLTLTLGSIIYWARQDAPEAFYELKSQLIDTYVEESLMPGAADWDYAQVLKQLLGDKYVCSNYQQKQWHFYTKHRWEFDKGCGLRGDISTELHELYAAKRDEYIQRVLALPDDDDATKKLLEKKIKTTADIMSKCRRTGDKDKMITEARQIFHDPNFLKNIDANPYLLGFTNGVFDFKEKVFRNGRPEDYISKSTKIPYIPFDKLATHHAETVQEIETFMHQLFPLPNVYRYMWDHLASTILGVKKEQVFNIYKGTGSNGKSLLVDLMSKCLGEYYGTLPIQFITSERSMVGKPTPELMDLKGLRYAVSSEPEKNQKLNEGIMKEITGGEKLSGREMFGKQMETFMPQFSPVVCTNSDFEVKSNDDGTWRRMKMVHFVSKFVFEGEVYEDKTKYVFPKNPDLKHKLPIWAPVFMSMLVKRACETEGRVVDCPEVIEASTKYRNSQDAISGFMKEKLTKVDKNPYGVNQMSLSNAFKEWNQMYGNTRPPKLSELIAKISASEYGERDAKTNRWHTFIIKDDNAMPEDEMKKLQIQ